MQRPIFMLVSGDGPRLDALRHDLSRRYQADYKVSVASSAAAALTMLAVLADARAEVALIIADEHLADMPAVDFLASAHGLHQGAKRILLIDRGNWTGPHPVIAAMAVGKIDYHLYVPWFGLEKLIGAGVFYGAAGAEARAMAGQDVYVVGAGNSAGQAALHLARYAATVTMVVRGADLDATMSSYLVTEISKTDNIRVRLATEVTGGHGQCSLETLTLRDRASGAADTVPAAALFVMIGAEPRTGWLPDSIGRDEEGFILTGRNLQRAGKLPADWPFGRPPLQLETSIPGVFAAGDVRHRSIKRVASAVGEGATAIQLVHEYLRTEQD
jgi:thioredoxin reductase